MYADGRTTQHGSQLRVLLVEDNHDLRTLFAILLTQQGVDVAEASNGREALEWMCRRTFDVVLTDFSLPDMTADELIPGLVAASRPRPEIVIVTGCDERRLRRARAAGADEVFRKPVEWKDIAAYLRRVKTARSA